MMPVCSFGKLPILRRLPLVAFFMFIQPGAYSHAIIQGTIRTNEHWKRTIYFSRMIDFRHFSTLIDSCSIETDGSFLIRLETELNCEEIVKMWIVPMGQPVRTSIEDGLHDNSVFIPLKGSLTINISANADNFFWSAKIVESNYPEDFFVSRQLHRLPLKNFLSAFENQRTRLTSKLEQDSLAAIYRMRIAALSDSLYSGSAKLVSSARTPFTLIIGLFERYYARFGQYDVPFFRNALAGALAQSSCVAKTLLRHVEALSSEHIRSVIESKSFAAVKDETKQPLSLSGADKTIIVFWASWCKPCRTAIREQILSAYDSLQLRDIDIVSISVDGNIDSARKAIEADGPLWLQLIDDGKTLQLLEQSAIPFYILYEKSSGQFRPFNSFSAVLNDIN